jgi:asparagine synthase (glutamine-hydrolysing)
MCGITGFIDFTNKTQKSVLCSMTDVLTYRGPDDAGYLYEASGDCVIGLGHRRLSILDLSALGHQPMCFENLVITYNGEVYNFQEIREELRGYGYTFDSNCDTEVILKAYHLWGPDMVQKFIGMFAFAIYDRAARKLMLCRDRAGVKPLYWYQKDGIFLFSSELKSFHQHPGFCKKLNFDALALFLQYGYIPQPYTIFHNCHKLKGGCYLYLDLNTRNVTEIKYWDVMDFYRSPKLRISEEEAIYETEKILQSAFQYRMVADVPVGMFLSGGYDSSVVTAVLQAGRTERLKTFTIGFHEEQYNEAHYAKKVAEYLGTDHTEYYCTQREAAEILPHVPELWDEPFGDTSVIPTVLVSRLARRYVTVSLSADGGDEAFGGYDRYLDTYKRVRLVSRLPLGSSFFLRHILKNPVTRFFAEKSSAGNAKDRLDRLAYMLSRRPDQMMSFSASSFYEPDLWALLKNNFTMLPTDFDEKLNNVGFDNFFAVDYKTYQVDDILTKVDRATMSVSLEGREPLLDHRIIEFVARLDPSLKIRNGNKKYLLKKIAHKYIPEDLLNRPKMGFGVPVFDWFRRELKDYLFHYLDTTKLLQDNIFNADLVVGLRDRYLAGKKIRMSRLWYLLVFQMWKERWL